MTRSLKGQTLFITGGSRGIGRAIALRAARDGANVAIASKTADPHPTLPGTIFTVAEEIEAAGGRALPLEMDVRNEEEIASAVKRTADHFGSIDILVNNASALYLARTPDTPMKRFDLMHQVNVRGTFATTQACHPYLSRARNPHVLVLSPPLNLIPAWFADHCAYTMSKYGMSMCVLGMAEEFRAAGIAVNALWPATMIDTAATKMIGVSGGGCRTPDIMADAAHAILTRDARIATGRFFLDEDALADEGVRDFSPYAVVPGEALTKDLFVA
ncbi:SDR family oxidoreductase [Aquabacter sp. P-9]|uniref:SDR family oxidoreductase n=1 Tax=Aquabacter sediminis TaxID=3029197 RepID=UPI00237D71D5|nr:NAD(P)-dependent oxidoreductase [Aquabacter sp. P-9]MDE1566579.1 NAD(P)-dependent oxidoreductase [Aquabacter sp. P-9]